MWRVSLIPLLCLIFASGGIAALFTVLPGATATASTTDGLPSLAKLTGVWKPAHEVAVSLNTRGHAETTAVSCGSPGNCSAVGSYDSLKGGVEVFVVNEVDGTWRAAENVPTSTDAVYSFNAISCPSAGNCSAVGENENISAFVLDETDGTWGKPQAIPATDDLEAVSCTRAGDCVAGGTLGYGYQAFLVTETHGTWGSPQDVKGSLDVDAAITTISCSSIGVCAAGGDYDAQPYGPLPGVGYPFVVNETDGTWGSATRLKGPFDYVDSLDAVDTVTSISCSSSGNCAAGGYYGAFQGFQQAFVVSESDGTWGSAREVAGALDAGQRGELASVSCAAGSNCAVAGTYVDKDGDPEAFVDDEVSGKWQPAEEVAGALNVGGYASLTSVSCASAGNCSAAGYYANKAEAFVGLVVTEAGGSWDTGQDVAKSDIDDGLAQVNSISCRSVGTCSAGGAIEDDHNYNHADYQQAFVVNETPATLPSAPTITKIRGASTSATVTWRSPASDGGAAITSYFVYYGTSPSKESRRSAPLSAATRSHTLKGLKKSTRYYIIVRATNALGLSAKSNQVSVVA